MPRRARVAAAGAACSRTHPVRGTGARARRQPRPSDRRPGGAPAPRMDSAPTPVRTASRRRATTSRKACLPGQDLAQTKGFESDLAEGEIASSPQRQAGRQPAQAGAVRLDQRPQQRPGVPGRLRLRRQLRRLHGLRHHEARQSRSDVSPGRLPRLAERHLGLRQPAGPERRLQPQRRHLRQRRAVRDDQGVVGGHPGLRHQRPGQPAVRRGGRDRLRVAHPHARPEQGRQEPLRLRLVLQPERGVPRLPAAARLHLASCKIPAGRAADAARRRRARPLPGRRQPGRQRVRARPAAATTSRPTRPRTSRPARAWATASCCDISDRGEPRVVTEQVRDTTELRVLALRHVQQRTAPRCVFTDELGGGGAATCNPERRPETAARTGSTTSRAGELEFASYYKIPRTQARQPRTASPTTAR